MTGELFGKVKHIVAQRLRNVEIDQNHHIPYLGGQSNARDKVYIDQRAPDTMTFNGKDYNVKKYMAYHEVVEKTIEDVLKTNYNDAHKEAEKAESDLIRSEGLDPKPYHEWVDTSYKKTLNNFDPAKVPHDLDLKPYFEDKKTAVIAKIHAARKGII